MCTGDARPFSAVFFSFCGSQSRPYSEELTQRGRRVWWFRSHRDIARDRDPWSRATIGMNIVLQPSWKDHQPARSGPHCELRHAEITQPRNGTNVPTGVEHGEEARLGVVFNIGITSIDIIRHGPMGCSVIMNDGVIAIPHHHRPGLRRISQRRRSWHSHRGCQIVNGCCHLIDNHLHDRAIASLAALPQIRGRMPASPITPPNSGGCFRFRQQSLSEFVIDRLHLRHVINVKRR